MRAKRKERPVAFLHDAAIGLKAQVQLIKALDLVDFRNKANDDRMMRKIQGKSLTSLMQEW